MFCVSGGVFLVLVVLLDMQLGRKAMGLFKWKRSSDTLLNGTLDEDVQQEMQRVNGMSEREISANLVVAKHLKKSFGKLKAVKDVTFVLER